VTHSASLEEEDFKKKPCQEALISKKKNKLQMLQRLLDGSCPHPPAHAPPISTRASTSSTANFGTRRKRMFSWYVKNF
jgi:hypothetical protein